MHDTSRVCSRTPILRQTLQSIDGSLQLCFSNSNWYTFQVLTMDQMDFPDDYRNKTTFSPQTTTMILKTGSIACTDFFISSTTFDRFIPPPTMRSRHSFNPTSLRNDKTSFKTNPKDLAKVTKIFHDRFKHKKKTTR